MPVTTRSQSKTKSETKSKTKTKTETNKHKTEPKKPFVIFNPPQPRVTFMTKEEYDKAGYTDSIEGGYIDWRLIAACIPTIINCGVKDVDGIALGRYIDPNCVIPEDKIYAIAPEGYYWEQHKIPYADYVYYLDKI